MKKYLAVTLIIIFATAGSLFMFNSFAKTEFQVDAMQAELRIDLMAPGVTEINVPPLGKVRVHTHKPPAGIIVTLKSIELYDLKKMVEDSPRTEELIAEVQEDVQKNFKLLIYRTLLLGILGGLIGVLILQRKRWYEYLAGAVTGFLVVALIFTVTYKSYNFDGFQNPEYEGMLKTAPWMISLVQDGLAKFNLWGKQMQAAADNLYEMFQRVESLEAMGTTGDGDIRVLHVSDIHNNPVAFDFIEQVAGTFNIDFIIDTGDISDFGTPLETVFIDRLRELKLPYVFVPGNHETEEIINGLKGIPQVRVLEGQPVTVSGVKILGFPDPGSYIQSFEAPDKERAEEWAANIREVVESQDEKPDVLAVHNHRVARNLSGLAPLILYGHDHGYKIDVRNKTVLVNAGTTGASGFGGLETKKETPYSLVVLQLKRTENGVVLIAADTIKVSNLQSGYSLERRMFPELYKEENLAEQPTE